MNLRSNSDRDLKKELLERSQRRASESRLLTYTFPHLIKQAIRKIKEPMQGVTLSESHVTHLSFKNGNSLCKSLGKLKTTNGRITCKNCIKILDNNFSNLISRDLSIHMFHTDSDAAYYLVRALKDLKLSKYYKLNEYSGLVSAIENTFEQRGKLSEKQLIALNMQLRGQWKETLRPYVDEIKREYIMKPYMSMFK